MAELERATHEQWVAEKRCRAEAAVRARAGVLNAAAQLLIIFFAQFCLSERKTLISAAWSGNKHRPPSHTRQPPHQSRYMGSQ